jgi:hypothetical protein
MVSVTHAAHNIESTAEGLQTELARLELQKQALERELAAVVAHLGSVRRALGALETLLLAPAAVASTGAAGTAVAEAGQAPTTETPQADVVSPGPADTTMPPTPRARKPKRDKVTERRVAPGTDTGGPKLYGKLTEQIMEYFAAVGDVDVRARDVAAALGRDGDSGSINAVRSTLDRLVGTSRVRRTGRGLYRAKLS